MAQSILDLYDSMQDSLGVSTISFNAGQAAITPYSLDDTKDVDDAVVTAEKLKVGRTGNLNDTAYSSTVVYNP